MSLDLSALSDEDQALAMQAASSLSPEVVLQLMQDAQRASELRDAGDLDGARAVLAPHREIAVRAGLEAVFDSLLS